MRRDERNQLAIYIDRSQLGFPCHIQQGGRLWGVIKAKEVFIGWPRYEVYRLLGL